MCGRYILHKDHPIMRQAFDIKSGPEDLPFGLLLASRYNIAPTEPVVTVVDRNGERHFAAMRWGLIPFWTASLTGGK